MAKTHSIYSDLLASISEGKRLLAILIDPDKMALTALAGFAKKINASIATHIFVGGSEVNELATEMLVSNLKALTQLPIVLFPGDVTQISDKADALLFLSLISGNNPQYLIGKHIEAASSLRNSNLEIIPTGYILIENGRMTSVEKVTQTTPLPRQNTQHIVDTAKAGELLGMKLVYLEAGSGALHPIPKEIIKFVKQDVNIPLIVGGGIRSIDQLHEAYRSGADVVVIGTAFEENEAFFEDIKRA
ncbi:geranylgeranylglyceryl/heptaprenylglyceryl phosphate synthase [Sediminibacter sp. Hel_I_10]|uniref:geranylgeranylglyceryl/heptaprenylglyceryl phosphate synthase n=1 Tax=Sediminibacter sp. Hel_I_10 TaxID=1392490 RepID=UPI00047A6F0F|nr:geranylgeranylglyceryl/heptaprenylglyceryl phosphate synthase [Sediminibacter sp. Hel_I_10]